MTMRCKPVRYKGQTYPSAAALMKHLGLSKSVFYARLRRGIPLDAPPGHGGIRPGAPHAKEVTDEDGFIWPSIAAFARAMGISSEAARWRVCERRLHPAPQLRACEYGGRYYRSCAAMDRALGLERYKGDALREEHEMCVCRTKVADYYHLDGIKDPRLEQELAKDFIAEAEGQIKYRFSVRDVFGDRLERMAVLYAKDKAPKLTDQDDIYDLHLDMARVYLPDIENAEVESYNYAD